MVYLTVHDDRKPLYQQRADEVAFFVSGDGGINNFHGTSTDDVQEFCLK